MKTPRSGSSPTPSTSRSASKLCELRAEGVALAGQVDQAEVLVVADDHAGAGAEDRPAGRTKCARAARPGPPRSIPSIIVVDLAARASPARRGPSRSAGVRTSRRSAPSARRCRGVGGEAALQREHADQARRSVPAAVWASSSRVVELARSRAPAIGSPRPIEAREHALGVVEVRGRLDDRLGARSGSADLKMPEPTKLPSAPSCIISAASAGVAMPPAQNSGTGSEPACATSRTSSQRRLKVLGGGGELLGSQLWKAA